MSRLDRRGRRPSRFAALVPLVVGDARTADLAGGLYLACAAVGLALVVGVAGLPSLPRAPSWRSEPSPERTCSRTAADARRSSGRRAAGGLAGAVTGAALSGCPGRALPPRRGSSPG